jgi:hypothetical protein
MRRLSCAFALLAAAVTTRAEAGATRGYVLEVENDRALIDLGRKHGLRPGTPVRVHRRYVLVHPVTRAKIEDDLPLGGAKVEKVGETIATVDLGKLIASAGDVVVVAPAPREEPRPPPSVVCRPCRNDEAAMRVHQAWVRALGKDASGRRAVWLRFLRDDPASPYREQIGREIGFLASLVEARPLETWPLEGSADRTLQRLRAGERFAPAVILPARAPRSPRAVYLFYRTLGAPLYARLEMTPDGDGYYRATVPPASLRPPAFEYFVEAVAAAGRATPVLGSAAFPWRVEVDRPAVRAGEKAGRSQFRIAYEYVDYFLPLTGHDFYWKMDAAFTYKVDFGVLRFFKLGFGFFEGFGGEARIVESLRQGGAGSLDSLAFGFVYLEPEIAVGEHFAIMPRLTLGQIDRKRLAGLDAGRRTDRLVGGHGFLRIGRRDGTNLYLGAGFTEDAGLETQITMNLAFWERTPIAFSAIVSNVPVNRDLGLILRAEVARRIGDWLDLGLHVGFAYRNINHTGVGAGTSLTFRW